MNAGSELIVLFDFKDPASYLALAPVRALIERTGVRSHWYPFLGTPLCAPRPPAEDADRATVHSYHRANYQARDLRRYAKARGLRARHFHDVGLYRHSSGKIAAMGFNWATRDGPDVAHRYLDQTFECYWDGDLDLDVLTDVQRILVASGAKVDDFDAYCHGEGIEALTSQRDAVVGAGGYAPPGCILNGEIFLGRQHLGYLEKRLSDGAATEDRN